MKNEHVYVCTSALNIIHASSMLYEQQRRRRRRSSSIGGLHHAKGEQE
jgi:hypothetical protein